MSIREMLLRFVGSLPAPAPPRSAAESGTQVSAGPISDTLPSSSSEFHDRTTIPRLPAPPVVVLGPLSYRRSESELSEIAERIDLIYAAACDNDDRAASALERDLQQWGLERIAAGSPIPQEIAIEVLRTREIAFERTRP